VRDAEHSNIPESSYVHIGYRVNAMERITGRQIRTRELSRLKARIKKLKRRRRRRRKKRTMRKRRSPFAEVRGNKILRRTWSRCPLPIR